MFMEEYKDNACTYQNKISEIRSIPELLSQIRSLFHYNNDTYSLRIDQHTVKKIKEILLNYTGNDWKHLLISGCGHDFSVLSDEQYGYGKIWQHESHDPFRLGIYAWKPQSATPFHDHGDRACAFYLGIGEDTHLKNEVYQKDLTNLPENNQDTLETNIPLHIDTQKISYIQERECGILKEHEAHQISNVHDDKMSYSIHLYIPRYETCRVWDDITSKHATIH